MKLRTPGAQSEEGQHQGEGIGHAGDGRDARAGAEHQQHAQAVDDDDDRQGGLAPHHGEGAGRIGGESLGGNHETRSFFKNKRAESPTNRVVPGKAFDK